MKIQFRSLALAGTSRSISFRPGFNLIHGPISTGKTSVLRLCRIALGAPVSGLPPEIRLLPAVGAEVRIGAEDLTIYRPLVGGVTAKVDVLSGVNRYQLPVDKPDALSARTFSQFLLDCLNLPQLRVPSAPTKPDSDSTPVSINDYMLYTDLPKEEIRSQVFGHRNPFKDIKRKYVFEILYGQYDIETARLQEQLREVRGDLRLLRMDTSAFERLLDGTPWSNRGELEAELTKLKMALQDTKSKERDVSQRGSGGKIDRELRMRLKRLDLELSESMHERKREEADVERFSRLASQLETQIGRLTRAIVANETLLDIEFVVCPRCGTSVDRRRAAPPHCYLCLQDAQPAYSKQDLVREQERLSEQLGETLELVESRKARVGTLNREIAERTSQRDSVGAELDRRLSSFISDSASALQDLAANRASLEQKIVRIQDYLSLFVKRDQLGAKLKVVEEEEKELLSKLDAAMARRDDVEKRIATLERYFTHYLRRFSLPDFLDKPEGKINRRTYLPTVNGRAFEDLQSEGLSIEVNVAHALAHHMTALDLNLLLPSILLLDGISSAFGDEGLDPRRVEAIYKQLVEACEDANGELQVLAVDTTLPEAAVDHVCLELSEVARLVPEDDLERLRAG